MDTQLVILTDAAGRDDGHVLPVPSSVKIKGAALKRVLGSLLKSGLISEQRAKRDDEVWRTDDNDGRLTLAITESGLAAIGIGEGPIKADPTPAVSPSKGARGSAKKRTRRGSQTAPNRGQDGSRESPRRGKQDRTGRAQAQSSSGAQRSDDPAPQGRTPNKSATIMGMLQAPDGASVADLMDVTGWQAHSIRGFLSGTLKKKLGYTVTSERHDGVRRYRIPA